MTEPRWLSVDEIVRLHAIRLAEFGGRSGIRDRNLLDAAVIRPQQRFHYGELRSLVDIAVAYATALNANHRLIDGNKRVSFHAFLVFLRLHGLTLSAPATQAADTTLAAAARQASEADVRLWVNRNLTRR